MTTATTFASLIATRYREAGKAVYGANEPNGEALARSYKWWRQHGKAPAESIERACLDYFRKESRWPRSPRYSAPGAPFGSDNLRWCEDTAAIGLRFVGFADELAGRSIDHKGWFTAPDGYDGNVLRGAVYQVPGRKGSARLVAGYREGSDGRKGWSDASGVHGSAAIAFGEIFESDGREEEAARSADGIAESYAEIAREYQEAWQAANRWQEIASEMAEARAAAKALVHDMRAAIKSGLAAAPSICAALRRQVRAYAESWEDLRGEREKLADEFWYNRDGKSLSIADFAAANL